jgi:phosphonopyruvate decarboxylase
MIGPEHFITALDDLGVDFFAGVPDSLLKAFCAQLMTGLPRDRHVIAANEGAAVGLAIGHYLRSGRPGLVYMQNSGFGNAVNPLISLADPDVYGIPMLLLVGWRGQPGVKDEPQHVKQGRVMTGLLDALELPWRVLPREPADMEACLAEAVRTAIEKTQPFVLLVEKDTFAEAAGAAAAAPARTDRPSREDALFALLEAVGPEGVQVSTTGMLSRELFEYRQANGQANSSGGRDFLTVGGMGHCSAVALGIAMQDPGREVWCLDGDGALLMHLGALPVIAVSAPGSFFHVVFNNGVHDSVGGQPTAVDGVNLAALALAAGYRAAERTDALDEIAGLVARLRDSGGPALLELTVRPGNRQGIGRPTETPRQAKETMMNALAAGAP